jgi:hypothetical protein
MKKIILPLIACFGLASSAFAGQEVKETKEVAPVEPCFRDHELQLDVFGSWSSIHDNHDHNRATDGRAQGFGGGVGVNYFFTRYLGVGIDGDVSAARNGLWDVTGELIARYPIETGTLCLAPYAIVGGGFQDNGIREGIWHTGGGLEWRVTHHLGIYAEGRYIWAGLHEEDNVRVSLGVRFVF